MMPWYRMPDGGTVHINFGRKGNLTAPKPCRGKRPDGTICGQISGYQCDWKMGEGKTCDQWICSDHAREVGDNKHLCPDHQEAYDEWLAAKNQKGRAS